MAAMIGSVFLGDRKNRTLSPPSSPPPVADIYGHSTDTSSMDAAATELTNTEGANQPAQSFPNTSIKSNEEKLEPITVKPAMSLELRLRWLETILWGARNENRQSSRLSTSFSRSASKNEAVEYGKGNGETVMRAMADIQKKLDDVVEGNEGLRRFMEHYDQNADLLTPSFALSGVIPEQKQPPSYVYMSPEELDAFLTEMEPEVRAADRDMREIELLEKRGVTGAGELQKYEGLTPRLDALLKRHQEDVKHAAMLEGRLARVMEQHSTHVDALSELFVVWDETLTEAENKLTRMERDKAERKRLGLD